jgi:UDP-3-O-[3-hydroxymyristoyl] glucosamine N-acyltransferase
MKLKELAQKLGCELTGDGEVEITGLAPIESAGPGELTFLANRRYRRQLKKTQAAAVIISQDDQDLDGLPIPTLRSANPYLTFAHALEFFYEPPPFPPGIHATAVVSPKAKIGADVSIGPYCFIDDDVTLGARARLHGFVVLYRGSHIGEDFTAHSHTVIREQCVIGNRVTLQNGVVIGCDGYGFAQQEDGSHYKIVQSGPVIIEDDVEIQANTCIDRATVGETRIKRGAKIDNLVQVGHASTVGVNSLLCAQVGLAGTTDIGDDVILAGQVGVAGHLRVGDKVRATAQTGIPNDVKEDKTVSGTPAIDNRTWLKAVAIFNRLPELYEELRRLRAEVDKLKGPQ